MNVFPPCQLFGIVTVHFSPNSVANGQEPVPACSVVNVVFVVGWASALLATRSVFLKAHWQTCPQLSAVGLDFRIQFVTLDKFKRCAELKRRSCFSDLLLGALYT